MSNEINISSILGNNYVKKLVGETFDAIFNNNKLILT